MSRNLVGDVSQAAPDWATLIVEGIDEALFSVDSNWRLTYLNSKAVALFDRSRDALLGMVLWDALPNVMGTRVEQLYRRAVAEQVPQHLEDFSHANQAWYDVWAYPIPQGLIIFFKDITERKQFEQSLQDSETRFRVLSESSFEGIVLHQNGIIIEANQRAVQMHGYNHLEEFIGQPLAHLVAPESLEDVQQRVAEGFDGAHEAVGLRKDGSRFLMERRGQSIIYHGQPTRVVALRDITERKQAEATLQQTQAQLHQAQKMESIGRLAGGIAHDFNNLLTIIMGYTTFVLEELHEGDAMASDVMVIQDAAQRAASLTRQLLAFSRQQVLEPRVLNLNTVVANMDMLLQRLIGKDIDLISALDPQLHYVLADPNQIEQVILNLAVNARDAMPDGGQLTLETANVDLDAQYRAAGHAEVKTGPYVMLAVSDTGFGMNQVTQQHIFEPFFTTKAPGQGTGLGLATVYGIVKQSNGYIWVYSEPGVGTTFKMYLPQVTDVASEQSYDVPSLHVASSHALPAEPTSGHGRAVLVVEDESGISDLILRVLGEAGYTTLHAPHGNAALDLLESRAGRVDLVLTDIIMPQMGGRELIAHVQHRWPRVAVLCMSGYTDRAIVRHGFLLSCQAFLQKPFTPAALLRRVHEVLHSTSGK